MKAILTAAAALLLGLSGCAEPPKTHKLEELVSGLANLHKWDASMQGRGQAHYDRVMGYGPEILPALIAHLTDETPTAIYEDVTRRNPKVCDVAFLMLLELTKSKWEDFADEGVFISTVLPNQIYCIKWDKVSKIKVQAKFAKLFPPEE